MRPQPADPYPGRPPGSSRSTNEARCSDPQRNQHDNLAPGQAPSTLTPPEKRHAELDRILDMIAKPLTPRHC
jgi:hypothetical protein